LVGIVLVAIFLRVISTVLNAWNPIPPINNPIGQPSEIPLWWSAANFGLFVLGLVVSVVLLFGVVYWLRRALVAKISLIVISLAIAAGIAAIITPFVSNLVQLGVLIPQDPADPRTQLFWRFLPQAVVSGFVNVFLLTLGAVALPKLINSPAARTP